MKKKFYVYILTNKPYGVFYMGVTSNLVKRIYEHKAKAVSGFTEKYKLNKLVYFEVVEEAALAMQREKTLKRWPREWKINMINAFNPDWNDLYDDICH